MGYHAVGSDNSTGPNGDSLKDVRSVPNPCAFADPDGPDVFRGGNLIADSPAQRSGMAVVICDPAFPGDQDVVFDDHFPVACNRHVVTDESPAPDSQRGTTMESARRNGKITAESHIVADVKQGMSLDVRQGAQLQMLSD